MRDGFTFWTGQLAKFTVLPFEAPLVQHVLLPGIGALQPLVYLFEVFLAVSLLLGVAVRFADIMAMLFTAHLWLGLYNDPTEWAWTYGAIIAAHGMFAVTEAGRSLGLDNLLRGQWAGCVQPPSGAAAGLPPGVVAAPGCTPYLHPSSLERA